MTKRELRARFSTAIAECAIIDASARPKLTMDQINRTIQLLRQASCAVESLACRERGVSPRQDFT
jgi:2-C-methyl-D-erythritol 4-phosphate cytidylyltransferase